MLFNYNNKLILIKMKQIQILSLIVLFLGITSNLLENTNTIEESNTSAPLVAALANIACDGQSGNCVKTRTGLLNTCNFKAFNLNNLTKAVNTNNFKLYQAAAKPLADCKHTPHRNLFQLKSLKKANAAKGSKPSAKAGKKSKAAAKKAKKAAARKANKAAPAKKVATKKVAKKAAAAPAKKVAAKKAAKKAVSKKVAAKKAAKKAAAKKGGAKKGVAKRTVAAKRTTSAPSAIETELRRIINLLK